MSNKRKLTTILGIFGATVLSAGGSIFVTDTALSLADRGTQNKQETESERDPKETELPIAVETFSKTDDAFVVRAKSTASNGKNTGDQKKTEASGNDGESVKAGTMYARSDVYVRSGADTSSEILGVLGEGQGIEATGNKKGNWIEVSYDGKTGYVGGSYLDAGSDSSGGGSTSGGSSSGGGSSGGSSSSNGSSSNTGSSSGGSSSGGDDTGGSSSGDASGSGNSNPVVVINGTMYATAGVNVRSGPGSDYSRLGAINTGESIGVTGNEYDGWTEVSYGGQLGYIFSGYLVWDQSEIGSGGSDSSGTSDGSQAWDDSYIYDVSSYYCDESEFDGWSATDLAYLRNEIFARHGRIFTSEKYRDYFSQKTWYNPTYDPSYFDANLDSFLNEYEWANLELIQKLEDARY